ncbi:MAG TPA: M2 family metallopeptidase [Gammaproteobacteria bacterium]|nr:M2 family metallopeptidase [Gammaproteobacteria bacterium]
MSTRTTLSFVCAVALLAACSHKPESTAAAKPSADDAKRFIADVDRRLRQLSLEDSEAQWVNSTYETGDTDDLVAHADDRALGYLGQAIAASKRYDGVDMDPDTARQFKLLKLAAPFLPPDDPDKRLEMTKTSAEIQAMYGSAKYCPKGQDSCRDLEQLQAVLADPANYTPKGYAAMLDAWQGWHDAAKPMRDDYARFVTLANLGARNSGYENVADVWQSGYDMPAVDFAKDTDRLWSQVQPLYQALHCYVYNRLAAVYGRQRMGKDGTIPAHLLGNMWAQDWTHVYPLVQPYPGALGADVDAVLQRQYDVLEAKLVARAPKGDIVAQSDAIHAAQLQMARQMVGMTPDGALAPGSAESFYQSMGMEPLPPSFWERSQFVRPRDRMVECHSTAWDMDGDTDLRLRDCLHPKAADLYGAYHELGHVHYYLAYRGQPYLFEQGANDGFHEAIGDTVRLAITPEYLHQVGLAPAAADSREAVIDRQMQMALDKVAFLPFGKLIDEWRWKVFDGELSSDHYNAVWWQLRRDYQGVTPPVARDETDFDPGAKSHIAANVPYMRYFLADIYQFQFYRALCRAAGHQGPLYTCSFFGSKEAGKKLTEMLALGASKPWQDAMQELTGERQADASAIIEYFSPLQAWLNDKNKSQTCSWK